MCNTTVRLPNQVVSAPFRRLNSKNYLKDAPSNQQPVKSESVPTPTHSATTVSNGDVPKKPMRPLTAYHIYFQIEREFIIQTLSGEDADKSIYEGKKCLDDVPDRYRATKLSPDWYFGPGKRAKRKHRKQHGKIGFLELSRVISTRWAKLEETDPDIKQFVSKLAKQELEVYQREVEEYKELTKNMDPSSAPTKAAAKKSKKRKQSEQAQQQEVAPAASMAMMMPQHQMMGSQPTPEMIASFQRTFYGASQPIEDNSFMNNSVQLRQEIEQLKNEIEHVNSCINKYSHQFNVQGQPTPTFTQTTSSAPPKKHFYRRQSSNISMSIFDSVMDEKVKNEPKAKKSFYRRQSSDMSLSFLDSIMDEMGKNKKSKKSFYRRQSSNKSFYRRQSSGISLSFFDSVMDEMGKNEPTTKKAKSSSAPKKNFYRRQSSTLSLSFLDPIADKLDKHETTAAVGATPAVRKQISDESPVNVADIDDDDIMSLWAAQNN